MPLNFQQVILKLQEFWAQRGCVLWQPYYTQVGAGTMNPATFLRVLGPEPWNVAYVEPSIRPDDGRYGENPNRFQQHYQFQVILKPDPGNPQEIYLESLKAIGVDPRRHDIRFVEDNWEQPAISAWGLGWEVWLDGQEITQFTYFQQVGGVPLDPVAVEITYGLERILIGLHNVKAAWDLPWNDGITYGEVRRQEEFEHSQYYFEVADVQAMRELFERFEHEAEACLAQGLVVPAHDYVLKCSHTFNVLDARGAVGVTERQAFFRRMRELARRVADAYLDQRRQLEYPLLRESAMEVRQSSVPLTTSQSRFPNLDSPLPFLLEIGAEELPAGDVDAAGAQLSKRFPALLDELHLEHGEVHILATPRRLVASVANLSPRQPDREDLVKGPPADKAFDKNGIAAPPAIGFAKKNGVDTKDLQIREQDGGKYVFAVVRQKGRATPEVLAEALPKLVEGLKFEKSMKWNASGVSFSRPIRWLVALLGGTIIPFEYAGLSASNVTRGLRPHDSPEIRIPSADGYFELVRGSGIVLDKQERRASIVEQVQQAAALVGGEALLDDDLLSEVANLVEMPTAVMGEFNPEFLQLPREVLISVMKKHQRYFPVERSGELLPHFIAIRNGDDIGIDLVRQGNEHVLGARFADANFFVREDLKHKLEEFRLKLSDLIFQTKLGSMLDKSERIVKLTDQLASMLGLSNDETQDAKRAAFLMKADLTTQMVTEMTSLQGIIGREYALRSGEKEEVADAIGEQYQSVPKSKIGVAIALADRIDSLVGLFAAGLIPTGAKDPFGLRRAALGVVQPLLEHGIAFDLRQAVEQAGKLQPDSVKDAVPPIAGPMRANFGYAVMSTEIQNQVLEFVAGRLSVVLKDAGYKYDVVDAVLAEQSADPAASADAVKQLQKWVERRDWNTILPAFARCVRITRDQEQTFRVDPKDFAEKSEQALFKALEKAESASRRAGSVDDLLNAFVPLIPFVDEFFDKVLVMAEARALKENRLGLLQRITALAGGVADFSRLEGF
ncbi:MAG TPA: glycine--tRNA ligase subunit beta [Anaerolineales bacterium]|nr:glycine--tRNA ligase subunit beta [Anaerolineales bacterium]